LFVLLTAGLISAPSVEAQIYKWTDADGNVHYTQTPPPGGMPAETLNPSTGIPSATGKKPSLAEELSDKQPDKEAVNKEVEQQQAQPTAAEIAERKRKCENVRARLVSLQRPRVSTVDESGNRVRLSEEQRQTQIKETKRLLKENCQSF